MKQTSLALRYPLLVSTVAGSAILIQLVQTRVLSHLFWCHAVYFTVTIALIGFGISGVFSAMAAARKQISETHAGLSAAAFGLSLVPCLALASHTPRIFGAAMGLPGFLVCYLVLSIPFLFAGYCLSTIFCLRGKQISRLYFIDLATSALAVILFVALFEKLGAEMMIWLTSFALVAVSCYFLSDKKHWHRAYGGGAIVVLSFLVFGRSFLNVIPQSKMLTPAFAPLIRANFEASLWTPITRLDVVSHPTYDFVTGTNNSFTREAKIVTQDGGANTIMPGPGWHKILLNQGDPNVPPLAENIMYELLPRPKNSLIIGVGGGIDIVSAGAYSAKNIYGVELNGSLVDLMRNRYADYAQWPKWPNVSLIHDEGRRYIRTSGRRFDSIMLKGVDTYAALASGAYIFAENYLYTVEAMRDYISALEENGIVTLYRFFPRQPRESLRLAVNYWYAKAGKSVAESIMVIGFSAPAVPWAATMLKRGAFTDEEIEKALSIIERDKSLFPAYIPNPSANPSFARRIAAISKNRDRELMSMYPLFERVITEKSEPRLNALLDSQPFDNSPVWDDKPFFFNYRKKNIFKSLAEGGGQLYEYFLEILLVILTVFLAFAIFSPLLTFQRSGLRVKGAPPILFFFSCLGAGYMFVEVGMMQQLTLYLGDPIYSLSAVLGGLLFFTGVGAIYSRRIVGKASSLPRYMVGAALALCLWLLVTRLAILPYTFTWSSLARVFLVIASLAPVGIFLGLPFAVAIGELARTDAKIIPWVWGINGLTSVAGSVLSILIAMRFGFSAVLGLAAGTYVLGAAAYSRYHQAIARKTTASFRKASPRAGTKIKRAA